MSAVTVDTDPVLKGLFSGLFAIEAWQPLPGPVLMASLDATSETALAREQERMTQSKCSGGRKRFRQLGTHGVNNYKSSLIQVNTLRTEESTI